MTETATVPYTDIVVSLTTQVSTSVRTVTIPTQYFETLTIYSPTIVETATSTVTRGAPVTLAPKIKRRGRCGPKTSSLTASSEPAEPSTTSTTSAPLFPTAYNCPSLEDYSSACACITAVDTTLPVTADAPVVTSVIPATVSVAVPSTAVSTVTRVDTSTAYVYSTVTVSRQTTRPTTTTTTVTSTSLVIAPTQTAQLVIGSGNYKGKLIDVEPNRGTVEYMPNTTPANIVFNVGGGQPYLAGNPSVKLWATWPGARDSSISFLTDAQARSSLSQPVICSVGQDGQLTCHTQPGNLSVFAGCNAVIWMNLATWETPECSLTLTLYLNKLRLQDNTSWQVQLPN